MIPRLTFADAEITACGWLREALTPWYADIYIGRNAPAKSRPLMVLVRRQGGSLVGNLADSPRLGLTVWAQSDEIANKLATDVVVAFNQLDLRGVISRLSITGPSEITAPDSDLPRRFISATYMVRGTQEPAVAPAPTPVK